MKGQANKNFQYAKKEKYMQLQAQPVIGMYGRTGNVLKNDRDIPNLSTLN
jgi:hypothetical protein